MPTGLKPAAKTALDRFSRAGTLATPRIIWRSLGEPGSGKTHFGLTAPGPIVVQSFDKGLEGVVEPFAEHKEVRIAEYDWSPTDDTFSQEDAIALRDQFIADFVFAIEHARTVLWDKETDIWNLFRYAEFGGPSDNPSNFSALNQRVRKYVNLPKKLAINFGCVQSLKDEWVSVAKAGGGSKGSPSGARKADGFKELEGLVHVDLFHERKGGQFSVTVGKSRGPGSRDVQDKTFYDTAGEEGGQPFDFTKLGMLLFPDTDTPDWR